MKSKANLVALLGLAATMGMPLPRVESKKEKEKIVFSEEDQAELDRLFQDRSSPGRKKYNAFKKLLKQKYAKG